MEEWIKTEAERLEAQRAEDMEKQGMKPLLFIEEGENNFEISRIVEPRKVDTKNGPAHVFELNHPAEKQLMASDYLYGVVIRQLAKQHDGRIRLLRTGQAKDTKYKCLEIK